MDTLFETPFEQETEKGKPNWGLLGHNWAVEMLREHLRRGSSRHAYLLTGADGVGKRSLAIRFIQAVNCPQAKTTGEPCLQPTCRVCRQVEAMQHADLKVVEVPEGKSEIPIDLIRELQAFLSLSPYESPFKIGLLLNFQRATVQAQNALLKTLEESPERAKIIITADIPENLLPTIVSRCELIRLRPLAPGMIEDYLIREQGVNAGKALEADRVSAGRPGFAIRYLDDGAFQDRRRQDIQDFIRVMNQSIVEKLHYVEEEYPRGRDMAQYRTRAKNAIQTWQSFLRDVLLRSANPDAQVCNVDFVDLIDNLSNRMTPQQAEAWISACDAAIRRIDGYCNLRLVLDNLLLENQ